jgi:hypothetical protein
MFCVLGYFCYFPIMQHFSDCDGNAIFGISSKQIAICTNSYQNPTQFDLPIQSFDDLGVLSKITNTTILDSTILISLLALGVRFF